MLRVSTRPEWAFVATSGHVVANRLATSLRVVHSPWRDQGRRPGPGPREDGSSRTRRRLLRRTLASGVPRLRPSGDPHAPMGRVLARGGQVAPAERLLLHIGLAEEERQARLHELLAEIESVGRVLDAELLEEGLDVGAAHEQPVVEDADG